MFAVIGGKEQEVVLIRDAVDVVRKLGAMVLPPIAAILPVLT